MDFSNLPSDIAFRLECAAELLSSDVDLLSEGERERYEAFGHDDRKRGFLLGRKAAKRLISEHENLDVSDAEVVVLDGGSPAISQSKRRLSISHAGHGDNVLAMACIAERPVGVDLELIAPRRADLYTRVLHPDEYGLLDDLDLQHNEVQLLLWSLKEAVLKGLQTGFRRSAKNVHLDDLSDGTGRAHLHDGPSWHLRYARHGMFWATIAFLDQ